MERIIRRMFLGGCLLTCLAVSLTAASSYAAKTEGSAANTTGAEMSTEFSLTVGPTFALTNVSFEGTTVDSEVKDYIQAVPGRIAKGKLLATVLSNTGYALQLSAENPDLTSSASSIPAKTFADTDGVVTESGWGVRSGGSTGNFMALTITPANFLTSANSAPSGTQNELEVGVSVNKTQPAGDYSTTVTLTVVKQP